MGCSDCSLRDVIYCFLFAAFSVSCLTLCLLAVGFFVFCPVYYLNILFSESCLVNVITLFGRGADCFAFHWFAAYCKNSRRFYGKYWHLAARAFTVNFYRGP